LRAENLGAHVALCGWVDRVRDHKGVIFIDLRDRWGRTQVVIGPGSSPEALAAARLVWAEWVLRITGTAFSGPAAPSEMLLDEAGQFLAQLAEDSHVAARANALIGVVLARMIVEFYGGTLGVAGPEAPGFVIRLPAAG
jgi:aspartyl/asparaginyl-tRNA synthetase